MDRIFGQKLHYKFLRFLHHGEASPPFSEEDIQPFRDLLSQFLEQNHHQVSWETREDQPLHLSILKQISARIKDADTTLFPALQNGVSTGFDGDIAPSSCFPVASSTLEDPVPVSIHMTNWHSAENDLETTRAAIWCSRNLIKDGFTNPRHNCRSPSGIW